MAMAMAVTRVVVAFEAIQDILALPSADLEVGGPDAVDSVSRPDQISIVAEDIRASLAGTMLLGRGVGIPGEGGDEQVPLFDVFGCRDRDVQTGRSEVRTRAELPVGRSKAQKSGCHCGSYRKLHGGCVEATLSSSDTAMPLSPNFRYIHLCGFHAPRVKNVSFQSSSKLLRGSVGYLRWA